MPCKYWYNILSKLFALAGGLCYMDNDEAIGRVTSIKKKFIGSTPIPGTTRN